MAGYIRQDVSNNIANGNVIDADDFDNEFDAIASAFSTSTGHTHDGSSAEGAPITVVGPAQDVVVSAIAVTPKTDDAYDLGSASNQWKDLYINGVANIDTLTADAGTVAGAAITTLSNTQTLTNKTLTSPTLTGTPTAPTAAAGTNTPQLATTAYVFAERTNAATLTNKTLTSPTLTSATLNDGYTEEVFAITGTTPVLSPTNGSIQTWTLTANSTPTAGTWAAGQSVMLMVDDGAARTITWTSLAVTWKTDSGTAPVLNDVGLTAITLWKVGTTIYGARVGDA
jgi:hypothetical protein